MTEDLLTAIPARRGHFVLESGLHTDRWLTLDALFVDARAIAPSIEALATRLRPHGVTAVCGPLLGGAFLAQAVAANLGVGFYYAEPRTALGGDGPGGDGIFRSRYDLPAALRRRVRNERVAVVDDVISAGSSVRATAAALTAAGATVAAVAALLVLGDEAVAHFAGIGVPLEALAQRALALWRPDECPLCRSGSPLEDPRGPADEQPRSASQPVAPGAAPPDPSAPEPAASHAASPQLTLVVLLHSHPDAHDELERFEQAAARIMGRYGGRIERRLPLKHAGDTDRPDEVHVVTFPDQASFDRYRQDPELEAHAGLRERAIRRTTVWHSR